MSEEYMTPHLKGLGPKFVQIEMGASRLYALDESGQVWCLMEGVWNKLSSERSE